MDLTAPRALAAQRLALLAGFALLAVGLVSNSLLQRIGDARIVEAAWFGLATLGASLLLVRLARVRVLYAWIALLAAIHVVMVGFAPAAATALAALAGAALGSRVVPAGVAARPVVAMVVGLGVIAAAIGWLLPYHVHRQPVYLIACVALIAWRRKALVELWREQRAAWRLLRAEPSWEPYLAVAVIAYVATSAWLPTAQFDDLSYHLALPWQLATLFHYRFDVQSQVWAVAPWSADVLEALVQVLARVEGRGALDTLWLLASLQLLWAIGAKLDVPARWRWIGLALFASQPLTHSLLQSMQTEMPMTAVVLAFALVVLDAGTVEASRARLTIIALLAGFALALKLSALPFVALLGLWHLARARGVDARALPRAIGAAFVVGGSSYVYAAILTGNPVLPLFNDVFASPYFAIERFFDDHYGGLLTWRLPYDLVIHGGRYYEGEDGVSGFQWLALLPTLLLALAFRPLRALAGVALACALLLMFQMQYLRYLYPAFALASMAIVAAPARAGAGAPSRLLVAALAALNVAALGCGIWTVRYSALDLALHNGPELDRAYLRDVAPERLLIRHLRERWGDGAAVLFLESQAPYAAELAGRGWGDVWYDPTTYSRAFHASHDDPGAKYRELFDALGATHVIVHPDRTSAALRAALAQGASLELRIGNAELHRLARAPLALASSPAPREQPEAALLDLWAPVASDAPQYATFEATLRCEPAGTAVAARLLAQVGAAQPQRGLDYELCPPSGVMLLQGEGRMRRTARVTLRLEPGLSPAPARFAPVAVTVATRNDVATQRDLSRSLRP